MASGGSAMLADYAVSALAVGACLTVPQNLSVLVVTIKRMYIF